MAEQLLQAQAFVYQDDGTPVITTYCIGCTLCPVLFTASGTNSTASAPYLAYQFLALNICNDADRSLQVIYDGFGTYGNTFALYANSATIYYSGCTTGSATVSVTLPAGTYRFDALVEGNCVGSGPDEWAFQVGCLT